MSGSLAGITVLDLTRVLSGPYCTMVLSDMGARVIKVEHPGKGDDTRHWGPPFVGTESAYFLSINRNKESVSLDFKHPQGRDVLHRLVAHADVLVENFKPGTMDRAGFGWEALHAEFPRLIYASISGYGQTGPRRDEPGYDAVIQAEGGLMSVTGAGDGPPYRLGVAISDIVAGMFAAQGVMAALFARERHGDGQRVDIGMLDTTAALLTYQAGNYFATGQVPLRLGNRHPTITPYETLPTSDGEIVIAVGKTASGSGSAPRSAGPSSPTIRAFAPIATAWRTMTPSSRNSTARSARAHAPSGPSASARPACRVAVSGMSVRYWPTLSSPRARWWRRWSIPLWARRV